MLDSRSMQRGLLLVITCLTCAVVVLACGGSEPSQSSLSFAIQAPADGTTVTTADIQATGTAPAGSRVVRDIPYAPDDEAAAGSSGTWTIPVQLEPGDNELEFRLGDDKSSAITVHVAYEPPSTPVPVMTPSTTLPPPALATPPTPAGPAATRPPALATSPTPSRSPVVSRPPETWIADACQAMAQVDAVRPNVEKIITAAKEKDYRVLWDSRDIFWYIAYAEAGMTIDPWTPGDKFASLIEKAATTYNIDGVNFIAVMTQGLTPLSDAEQQARIRRLRANATVVKAAHTELAALQAARAWSCP